MTTWKFAGPAWGRSTRPTLAPLALGFVTVCSGLALAPRASAQDDGGASVTAVAPDHDDPEHDHADHDAGHHAGEGHVGHDDHGDAPPLLSLDIGSAFWNLLIFLAVLAILGKFVWPSVLGGLQAREEKIRDDLQAAEKTNAQAQRLLVEYQTRLDEAAAQVQSMLAEARRGAESAGQRIVDEAKQQAERQREQAVADIEAAKRAAMTDLAGQTAGLAMQVARSVVGRELKAEDHTDLIRQSIEGLPNHQ